MNSKSKRVSKRIYSVSEAAKKFGVLVEKALCNETVTIRHGPHLFQLVALGAGLSNQKSDRRRTLIDTKRAKLSNSVPSTFKRRMARLQKYAGAFPDFMSSE